MVELREEGLAFLHGWSLMPRRQPHARRTTRDDDDEHEEESPPPFSAIGSRGGYAGFLK